MTNHPRRAGRRKHRRQGEAFEAALRQMTRATTASARQMHKLRDAARRAGNTWPTVVDASLDPTDPNRAVLLWGNGRLDVIDNRPLWQKEPA